MTESYPKHISPFYVSDNDIQRITERIVPVSTVCGEFANVSPGLNDGSGFYFEEDDAG